MATRTAIGELPTIEVIDAMAVAELPALIAELAALQARAAMRLRRDSPRALDDDDASAAIAEAITALESLLANGPVGTGVFDRTRRELGISERAWRVARHRLKVEVFKESFSGAWAWRLPEHGPTVIDVTPATEADAFELVPGARVIERS